MFNVTGADGAPTTQLCPGANYTLEVGWEEGGGGTGARYALNCGDSHARQRPV